MNRIKSAFNVRENIIDIFISPEGNRYPQIDGIRALSMLYVMCLHSIFVLSSAYPYDVLPLVHSSGWYWQWIFFADRAVDSFFVISGFLIGTIMFKEYQKKQSIDLAHFYKRRLLRIAPVYYFTILIFAIFAGPEIDKKYLWTFVFYINNFFTWEHNYIPVGWSLAVEEQFYIVFALFCSLLFFKLKNRLVFLILIFISSFFPVYFLLLKHPELLVANDVLLAPLDSQKMIQRDHSDIIYDNFYTRYGSLVVGIIVAYIYVYHWPKVQAWMTALRCNILTFIVIGTFFLMSVMPLNRGGEFSEFTLYAFHLLYHNVHAAIVGLLIIVSLFPYGLGQWCCRFLSLKIWYPVSQLSYSMYLIHLPMLGFVCIALRRMGMLQGLTMDNVFTLYFATIMPLLFFSTVLSLIVERPFMKLRR